MRSCGLDRDERLWRTLGWCVPLALWVGIVAFTAAYAVDVPYMDSWDYTEFIAGLQPVTLKYLWMQHNEHRLVWEKLFLYAGWARATGWNEYGAAFIPDVLVGLAAAIFLIRSMQRRPHATGMVRAMLVASLSLWLFTFRQWQNLIWSAGFSWALLFLAFVLFEEYFRRYVARGRGVWPTAVLLIIAPFCCANGLALPAFVLLWGALALWLGEAWPRSYLPLCLLAAMMIVSYLIAYHKPPPNPSLLAALTRPWDAAAYSIIWLGSPFHPRPLFAGLAGLAFVVTFIARAKYYGAGDPSRALRQILTRYPHFIIGAIVLVVMMIGRVGFGPRQAAASRYVNFSVLVVVTGWLYLFDSVPHHARSAQARVGTIILTISVLCWYAGYVGARDAGRAVWSKRATYRDCVLSHPTTFSLCDASGVYPDGREVHRRTEILRQHRLSFFRDAR
jgi:hypothetical protein